MGLQDLGYNEIHDNYNLSFELNRSLSTGLNIGYHYI